VVERNDENVGKKFEIERFSVTSSMPFDAVVAALKASVGRLDLVDSRTHPIRQTVLLSCNVINRAPGKTGLMLLLEHHGAVLRKETGLDKPKMVRLVVGNPLFMREMAKRVPDAGSYAPVTILVDERSDGVHLTYDRMVSLLAPYGNTEALKVARDLDLKVEKLMNEGAA
jgi:uncharacterized protein (DUF302 family)